jgi:xanthine/CO dehydrogenase XdhC/CoxF family maturation factor
VPMRTLLVVGDGPVAEALAPLAEQLGWTPTIVTTHAEAEAAVPRADAVVVTSHREDVDGPALKAALSQDLVYIGGMGSRKTQARRREWLAANGVTDESQQRIHGPAGLDIGADTPAEIALSILAELVATVRGRADVGSIKDREGPIHPELGPGQAFCPTG